MNTRNELFLAAVDILQSGRSLDVDGEHGSGRTHFLHRVDDYFVPLGWRTIFVTGLPAFAQAPLAALAVAGVGESRDGRKPGIAATIDALTQSVQPGRTLILVDDWDALDEYSAGVIRTVQAHAGVPVLSTRLIHRSPLSPVLTGGAFTMTYAMRLPGMGYSELEAALEGVAGFRVEPGTLSRVFAKSGGNIGLAAAVIDTALRADHLVVEDGVAHATGSLWSPALRLMADVILAPLPPESRDALEILAVLGPSDIDTAARAVGLDRITDLENRAFLNIIDVGGSKVVSIHPPLLVENFRHHALPGRRSQLLARIDDLLSDAAVFDEDEEQPTGRDSAAFVRLVHEHTRRRTLQAREAWQSAPTLRTATDLLSALEVDGAHDPDELDALLSTARGLQGTEREQAEWDVVRLVLRAVRDGEAAEAVAELRERGTRMLREGGLLLGRAAELEASFIAVPAADPTAGYDISPLSPEAQRAMLRARGFWLLARGLHVEAERALADIAALDAEPDPLSDALAVLAHLEAERTSAAERVSAAGLAAAQRSFDASLIRVYAYLAVLTAMRDGRPDDAERILAESSFLGLPSPVPALSFIGLKTLAAELAARRGQRGLMEQQLADIDAAGLSGGPFLGQNGGIAYAALAAQEEGREAAARICMESGDALWERGALFSAADAYVEAMLYAPSREAWARIAERVRSMKAPGVARRAEFVQALLRADAADAVRRIAALERTGRAREALRWTDAALEAMQDVGGAVGKESREQLVALRARLHADGVEPLASPSVVLTARELEVAELVASGLSNAVIAEALVLSVRTVESHVNRLLRKTGLHRRQDIKGFLLAQDAVG